MTYKLKFIPAALKEWKKLAPTIQQQFKKKLKERLVTPHVPAARLHELEGAYKIKLMASGYRLVYQVQDEEVLIMVLSVGKRERSEAYRKAKDRLQ
ncbi:type II toxin-antitoxin system RelE family toxin [Sansalvadorimonas verongulae]|uniref:type II toxin-antitoxin system RelE family toxin n=1 Tax=Sansalvadorimonas verongulae TaxID=2172824 RepID=UPI0012BB9804|nr:type II toxin-antitoxin system RelE/ParE family toxin [Sansalvadorimonas verongulae]MTI11898.1 type II toxin-antitoxin system RelE/ParE family toxin [Sansalvadorimonas verongulae]